MNTLKLKFYFLVDIPVYFQLWVWYRFYYKHYPILDIRNYYYLLS